MASFYLNPLFKDAVSQYSHILGSWGLVLQHTNLGGGVTLGPVTLRFPFVV